MLAMLKALFYLAVLGFLGLVGFAYLGPLLGVDFSAPTRPIEIPYTLDPDG